MPRLKIKFSDGSSQEFACTGELIGFEITRDVPFTIYEVEEQLPHKKEMMDLINGPNPHIRFNPLDKQHTLLGTWLTDQQFTVEIYALHENKQHWLGKCKDCGEGKDKLIYDLDGKPVNYPEFGKVMNRLDQNDSFRAKL